MKTKNTTYINCVPVDYVFKGSVQITNRRSKSTSLSTLTQNFIREILTVLPMANLENR